MRNFYYKLDEDHNPVPTTIDNLECGTPVAKDTFVVTGVEILVSTVFLGIDHSFIDGAKPILFETMVFGGEHDEDQYRYHTWDEAVEGHNKIVNELKNPIDLNIIFT